MAQIHYASGVNENRRRCIVADIRRLFARVVAAGLSVHLNTSLDVFLIVFVDSHVWLRCLRIVWLSSQRRS
jgi:hypothetical protein